MHESKSPAVVKYGGLGRGYFVTRRYTLDGFPQTVTIAGPFTSREQAQREADGLNTPGGCYSVPRQCPVCAMSYLSRRAYWAHVSSCHEVRL